TITYRGLFQRGVIVEPKFEPPITIAASDWSDPESDVLADLADYILNRSETDFIKTLVVVSRQEYAEQFYDLLELQLAERSSHVLGRDDIGFAHAATTSSGASLD